MAKDELGMRGIQYEYIDLELAGKTAAEVTGRKVTTLPQIYLNGEYVGGYDQLMALLNNAQVEEGDECVACQG